MDNMEQKMMLRTLDKANYEASLFWQLSSFIGVMHEYNENDAERIELLQERAKDMQNDVLEYRCTRSTIDELKDEYRTIMGSSSCTDIQLRYKKAIMDNLTRRGIDPNWYIDEG